MKHSKLISLFSSLVLAVGLMAMSPGSAQAHNYRPGSTDEHPLRLVAYIFHPIGVGLEWGITRPMHWLASQPTLDILMGHKARVGDKYFEWKQDDGSPGIAEVERNQQQQAMKKSAAESETAAPSQ